MHKGWQPMNLKSNLKSHACMVILSGGQDSTTCLYWAKEHFDEVHAVSFDYGQKHHLELESARKVAGLAGVASHVTVPLGPVLEGRSPLTNPQAELETYENFQEMDRTIGDRIELTFVPMRNALFMVLAANQAICKDIYQLVTGVCQADNANYPDCRQEYVDYMAATIQKALGLDQIGQQFLIHCPLMNRTKAETIRLALEMPGAYEALAWTHTAYDGKYPPMGKDHASTLRAQGFADAGVPDPLVIRAWREGLMELPFSANYDKAHAAHPGPGKLITADLNDLLAAVK
jgi:7-cyano-7-deazaguanine synthase